MDDLAGGVEDDQPVGVAVVGEPEVELAVGDERPEVTERLGGRLARPAREEAVDVGVERDHVRPERLEDLRGRTRGHPVAAVDGDPEAGTGGRRVAGGRSVAHGSAAHSSVARGSVTPSAATPGSVARVETADVRDDGLAVRADRVGLAGRLPRRPRRQRCRLAVDRRRHRLLAGALELASVDEALDAVVGRRVV